MHREVEAEDYRVAMWFDMARNARKLTGTGMIKASIRVVSVAYRNVPKKSNSIAHLPVLQSEGFDLLVELHQRQDRSATSPSLSSSTAKAKVFNAAREIASRVRVRRSTVIS
jgi:hypothetical protein